VRNGNLPVIQEDRKAHRMGRFTKDEVVSVNLGICQEQFKKSMEVYSPSLREADAIQSYIEGRHYSMQTLAELRKAQRPAEAHNLMLRLQRLLTGHFMKVVTTAIGEAVDIKDTETAHLHNENFKVTQRLSKWKPMMTSIVKDLITKGLGAWSIDIKDSGRRDFLERPIFDLKFKHIPSGQVLPDPRAVEPDKSDAKYIHYWEYLAYEDIVEEFGEMMALRVRMSHQSGEEEYIAFSQDGLFKDLDDFEYWKDGQSYFIVRTYHKSKQGVISMTSWHGDIELHPKTKLDVKMFPIMCVDALRIESTNRYYSPLYEIIPAQDAINQAILAFQKLVGENRVIADKRAVTEDELPALQAKLKTIGDILHVRRLDGIRVESLSGEAIRHLDKMHTSIQLAMQVIGINEAFLGQSKAGDSGRKFEGQVSQSEATLDYLATPIDLIYVTMYKQNVHYAGVYKQAEEYLRFVDDFGKSRWQLINEPFFMPTGEVDEDGDPVMEVVPEEVFNHTTGKYETMFVNERAKSLSDIAVEVEVHSAPYDDTDAVELTYLEGMLNGQVGGILASAHPATVLYLQSLVTEGLKTRNSELMAKSLRMVSEQLGALPIEDPRNFDNKSQGASGGGQGNASTAGAGQQGTQGVQGKMLSDAGVANDNQPIGYNRPKGEK